MLASRGEVSQIELEHALHTLGLSSEHTRDIDDKSILGMYQTIFFDAGPVQKKHLRGSLKLIADFRNSDMLRSAATERKEVELEI
jgi:hypothetical protein